jgi:hypothetical protein
MKILIVLPVMLTLSAVCADSTSTSRVIELAGMPVAAPPPPGALLTLAPEASELGPDFLAVFHGGSRVGYIPARYRNSMERALQSGACVRVRSHSHSPHPTPGSFLRVEIEFLPRHPGDEGVTLREELPEEPE